jgi:hypothetical protein|tara:strand:+ start:88 stop:321 length:234 start_codon:yes stop_codon:yes gene_type:complete
LAYGLGFKLTKAEYTRQIHKRNPEVLLMPTFHPCCLWSVLKDKFLDCSAKVFLIFEEVRLYGVVSEVAVKPDAREKR